MILFYAPKVKDFSRKCRPGQKIMDIDKKSPRDGAICTNGTRSVLPQSGTGANVIRRAETSASVSFTQSRVPSV